MVSASSAEWETSPRLAKTTLGCSLEGGKGGVKNVSWSPRPWAITFPSRSVAFSGALPVRENFSSAKLFTSLKISQQSPILNSYTKLHLNSPASKTCTNNDHLVQPRARWKVQSEIWFLHELFAGSENCKAAEEIQQKDRNYQNFSWAGVINIEFRVRPPLLK